RPICRQLRTTNGHEWTRIVQSARLPFHSCPFVVHDLLCFQRARIVATAGYSGTPLAQRLGITPGMRVWTIGAPAGYAKLVAPLPDGALLATRPSKQPPQMVHLFTHSAAELRDRLRDLRQRIAADGVVWVSWPKKASKVQ